MNIKKETVFNKWNEFTFTNNQGMSVSILDFGGIITKILAPDHKGNLENVVLGFKNYADYKENPNFFGALIGRVGGRIQDASFEIDGKKYALETNDGAHHLHGGSDGFHHIVWDAEPFQTDDAVGVILKHKSPDGTSGYPGNLDVVVTYTLDNNNALTVDYWAKTDKATPLTLTNHSYFNLTGDLKDTVQDHEVTMNSSYFVELDNELIPTGKKLNVSDTTFDFRNGRKLGDGFKTSTEQYEIADNGYDHNFIFDEQEGSVTVKENTSGRTLKIKTDQPGMVMYTANSLDEGLELTEGPSRKHLAVCFETQASPASLHHTEFPSVMLKAGETYQKRTVFSFG